MMVLTPAITHALDLGKLRVYSSLTAPLHAEVELIAPAPEELNTLVARVLMPTNFAGSVESQRLLSDIKVTVTKRSDESYFLQLRSTQALTEPFLQILLEATWAGGHSTREFTALFDPPRSVESIEHKEPIAADKAVNRSAEPQQLAAPAPIQGPTSHPAVDIARPGRASVQPQAISEASVIMSSDKNGEPAPPATTQTHASIGEPTVEKPREKPSAEARVPAGEPEAGAARRTEPASPPPRESRPISRAAAQTAANISPAAASRPSGSEQNLTAVAMQMLRQTPTWVLMVAAALAVLLLLLTVGLTVLIVRLHRRHAQQGLETTLPAPKLVTPEAPGEGNGRWRDRRQRIDRRQQFVPVAIERRTGLARRRSELADDGITTVCVEVSDPIGQAEAYMAGGFYEHAEQALEDAIAKHPSRLDLKVKLLEVYEQAGNESAFRILAEELRPKLGSRGGEYPHSAHGGANGEETALLDDLPVPEGFESEAVARQRKSDRHRQPAAAAESGQHMVEWETVEARADASLATVAMLTRHERQTETLSRRCGATPSVTLQEAFSDFLSARKKLKASTIAGYKRVMATALADWGEKALREISADMVSERHAELSQDRGEAYANRSMRFLRTLYTFALERYENGSDRPPPENPVQCL